MFSMFNKRLFIVTIQQSVGGGIGVLSSIGCYLICTGNYQLFGSLQTFTEYYVLGTVLGVC